MVGERDLLERESRRIASLWKLLRDDNGGGRVTQWRALVPGSRSSLEGLFKLVDFGLRGDSFD